MSSYKNILLINFGGIGDEILFMPVIQSLRKTYKDAKITLCLESRSSAFVKLTDLLDGYFCIDIKTKNKYIQMLKLYFKAIAGRYDLVISSGGNPLIPILLFFTGIKTRIGYNTSSTAKKLLTYAADLNKNQYASKMYFELVRPVTTQEFELPEIKTETVSTIPNSVLVHPGVSAISVSKKITKTLPPEQWALIIKELLKKGKNVYLAGGPDDTDCIEKIRKQLENTDLSGLTDMFGKTKNLFDLVELIKKTEILICSDSAPMHIGVAVNKRTIAIFGPTNNKNLLPNSDKFTAVYNNTECRPCLWKKRQTTCESLDCLKIDINKILELI